MGVLLVPLMVVVGVLLLGALVEYLAGRARRGWEAEGERLAGRSDRERALDRIRLGLRPSRDE